MNFYEPGRWFLQSQLSPVGRKKAPTGENWPWETPGPRYSPLGLIAFQTFLNLKTYGKSK
jgi:hypothetical protein